MAAELAQLIQQQTQAQGVGGLRVGDDFFNELAAEILGVTVQEEGAYQLAAFFQAERLDSKGRPVPFQGSLQRGAGQAGKQQARVFRQFGGQPAQLAGSQAFLQLVERVQNEDVLALGCRHIEPVREIRAELLFIRGDFPGQVKALLQFCHQAAQHGRQVRRGRRRADEVGQHQLLRVFGLVPQRPVGKQRGLARTGLAQHQQGKAAGAHMRVHLGVVLLTADVELGAAAGKSLVQLRFLL